MRRPKHKDGLRWCAKCANYKNLSEFGFRKTAPDGLDHWCKECNRANAKRFRDANLALCLRREKQRRLVDRERILAREAKYRSSGKKRAKYLAKTYGISPEQYDVLLKQQAGTCALCPIAEELCVDHDHATGKVRGLLCNRHNLALGLLGDSEGSVEKALTYLRGTKC